MANSRKSKSSDLIKRVGNALVFNVPVGSTILLGLSGGVDSVVLLHLLAQLSPRHSWQLSALHVHHGISPHADKWADFCSQLCEKCAIPLQVERVDLTPLREKGIEAAARELRHGVLARQSVDFIALAHHQDDQAETLLLQLLRGAGVKGAAAMSALQSRNGTPALLRPLLEVVRAELEAYAKLHGLQWVEDESNADDSYPRNFLRHRVLPLLEESFPACRTTLARDARHFAEAAELLDVLAEQDALGALDGVTLAVDRLAGLAPLRAKNLLRWFLCRRGALMPQAALLEEMLRQLCVARADAQVCIAWGDWEARRYRGRVYVRCVQSEPAADLCIPWHGEVILAFPGGALNFAHCRGEGISADRLTGAPVTIRFRLGKEILRPDAARPARTLHYLFQEYGIPPWQRTGWPLLYCGETLVAAPGIGVECAWQAAPDEESVKLVWVQ